MTTAYDTIERQALELRITLVNVLLYLRSDKRKPEFRQKIDKTVVTLDGLIASVRANRKEDL